MMSQNSFLVLNIFKVERMNCFKRKIKFYPNVTMFLRQNELND